MVRKMLALVLAMVLLLSAAGAQEAVNPFVGVVTKI